MPAITYFRALATELIIFVGVWPTKYGEFVMF